MEITEIPEHVLHQWKAKGYVLANHCFANCSTLVFQLPAMNFKYVLCWVYVNGQRHPHAVINSGDHNFDPTLQGSDFSLRYKLVKRYSRTELIEAIVEGGGNYNNEDETICGFPPALLENGEIDCTEVKLPSL